MKVILDQDVKKLGKSGDIVEVSDGYARNYLLPRSLAREASQGNVKMLNKQKEAEAQKTAKELERVKKQAAKLEGARLEITAKAGDQGRLFGSVTNKEIAEQLAKKFNMEIDKRKIELAEPLKSLGSYHVNIKLHPQVAVAITVDVQENKN